MHGTVASYLHATKCIVSGCTQLTIELVHLQVYLRHVDLWIASYLLLNWHFEELIIQNFVLS
jgi:hypothetical protein